MYTSLTKKDGFTMEALVMPSTPVLIYGLFVLLFILIAIPVGRMIDEANKETDESIKLLQQRRNEQLQEPSENIAYGDAPPSEVAHRLPGSLDKKVAGRKP